jgi:hypothetical protein
MTCQVLVQYYWCVSMLKMAMTVSSLGLHCNCNLKVCKYKFHG